jgi:hypothetical protein
MPISRRLFILGTSLAAAQSTNGFSETFFDDSPPLPDKDTFQSGDLVWPKKPGTFVPYSQDYDATPETDQAIWERERTEFLRQAETGSTHLTGDQLEALKKLDYREFLSRYHADQQPGEPGVYGTGGGIYVGHVGIVDVSSDGEIYIIEALLDRGVVRTSYRAWLDGRPEDVVWLGRLRERSRNDRASVAVEARKYVGRPYGFWNFDLDDDSEFYCSKLVWLCIFRRLGFAVDANPNPRRYFWLSPKQLLYLPVISRLHDPGNYAAR